MGTSLGRHAAFDRVIPIGWPMIHFVLLTRGMEARFPEPKVLLKHEHSELQVRRRTRQMDENRFLDIARNDRVDGRRFCEFFKWTHSRGR
jgi:hypothetical protein